MREGGELKGKLTKWCTIRMHGVVLLRRNPDLGHTWVDNIFFIWHLVPVFLREKGGHRIDATNRSFFVLETLGVPGAGWLGAPRSCDHVLRHQASRRMACAECG